MNNKLFIRKVLYIASIALLLIPLFLLGQPSYKKEGTLAGISGGGELAKIRHRYRIGQADIGQIDPASESMRLATLGMRGIAAAWLWQKAEYYKEEKYFDRLSATLNQISLLQPHFVKVWESQAHNLAYNVSHEFDDYRQRYAWVKKGIDYLVRGTQYNEREPILQWHLGKYMTMKLGRSDEQKQFRELYRNDDDFHEKLIADGLIDLKSEALGADRKPDNWLSGRLWYLKAYDLVDSGALLNKNEVHFYAEAPWAQMYYSEAIEKEGILDDRARFAWSRANESWREFGNRDILTTWGDRVQLRSLGRLNQVYRDLTDKFSALTANINDEILKSSREQMSAPELFVLDADESTLDEDQLNFKRATIDKYLSNRYEIAKQLPLEKRAEGISLAATIASTEEAIRHTDSYRNMCNYAYWDMRSEAEQSPVTLAARQQMYEADLLIDQADLNAATQRYEKAWLNWNAVFRRYPEMMLESIADDVLQAVRRYMSATDTELEESFVLYNFISYRMVRDSNRADVENNKNFQQMLREAPAWESAMDEPALLTNDHVPQPKNMKTGGETESNSATTSASVSETSETAATDGSVVPPAEIPTEEDVVTGANPVETASELGSVNEASETPKRRPPPLTPPMPVE